MGMSLGPNSGVSNTSTAHKKIRVTTLENDILSRDGNGAGTGRVMPYPHPYPFLKFIPISIPIPIGY